MNVSLKTLLQKSLSLKPKIVSSTLRALSTKKDDIDKELEKSLRIPKDYDVHKVTKEDMHWRWDQHDEDKHRFKMLRIFYTEVNNVEIVKTLQTPLDLSFATLKRWVGRKNKENEIRTQLYNPERNQVLGDELAAAHFIVYRGGAIKFHGDDKWVKADEDKKYVLPDHYVKDKYIEAIDCSDTEIYYEGLQNFKQVKHLKWLSFNDCPHFDDWCLDSVCGAHYKSLVYLDLRNCPNITERGLTALWKMEKLRVLYLDDIVRTSEYEMTVYLLQDQLKNLEIGVGDFAEDD